MKMKKCLICLLCGLTACSLAACSAAPAAGIENSGTPGQPVEIAISSASTGGAYYPIASAFADILSNANIGINARNQTTGGALENIKLVNSGETELGVTVNYLAYNAYNGREPYTSKMENFSLLFSGLSTGVIQIVVPENSPIQTIGDFKGKKIAVGPAGGAALPAISDLLSLYDMTFDDISASYVSYEEGVEMMSDGDIDCTILSSAVPAAAIQTLAASQEPFRMISIDDELMQKIQAKFPHYSSTVIAKDVYGTPEDVQALCTTNIVIVNNDLSEEMVYQIMQALFAEENFAKIKTSHPSTKNLSLESAVASLAVPLHPGAEKFFREKGVLS